MGCFFAIENKLIYYKSGNSIDGLDPYEAEIFLDWITFNAREYAISESKIKGQDKSKLGIELHSMTGQCAPTQRINVQLLKKIGLDAKPINMVDCIGKIDELPKSDETNRTKGNQVTYTTSKNGTIYKGRRK